MKHYTLILLLLLLLLTSIANAGPFAEVGLSVRQQYGKLGDGYVHYEGFDVVRWRMYDINETKNPYASIMVGYNWTLKPGFDLGLAVRHESSISTGKDRGINDLRLTLRWSDQ